RSGWCRNGGPCGWPNHPHRRSAVTGTARPGGSSRGGGGGRGWAACRGGGPGGRRPRPPARSPWRRGDRGGGVGEGGGGGGGRVVERAWAGSSPGRRSQKICRGQPGSVQRKRRTNRRRTMGRS